MHFLTPFVCLQSYQELDRNGTVLNDALLEEQLHALNHEFSGILEHTDRDVEALELQLEQLVEVEEKYEKLLNGAKKTDLALTKELSELERSVRDQEYVLEKVATNSVEMARQLEESQQATQQQISDLQHCYYQRVGVEVIVCSLQNGNEFVFSLLSKIHPFSSTKCRSISSTPSVTSF